MYAKNARKFLQKWAICDKILLNFSKRGVFMLVLWIFLSVVAVLGLLSLAVAYVCFFRIFRSPRAQSEDKYALPEGEIYEEYREQMVAWMKNAEKLPHRAVSVRSHDGLCLHGEYYECEKGAPLEILFHGYHGSAFRDLSGGVARCFALGHNALIIDHRGSGKSEGKVTTFGILERRDCLAWVDFAIREWGSDVRIILTGISMGASTVMMAAGEALPGNVIGVLADCGYTSARAIIQKVMRNMKLPARLLYPFARLGARLFGGFDLDETSPVEAMARCKVPVIFFHGDADDFVPHAMSLENYEACTSKKRLVTIGGAGHGLAFPADEQTYLRELRDFFP